MAFIDVGAITTPTMAISCCNVCHLIQNRGEVYMVGSHNPAFFASTGNVLLKTHMRQRETPP